MSLYYDHKGIQIYLGDCREILPQIPTESVHCCVTSPPYWGLRDYGTASWVGGRKGCDHLRPRLGGEGEKSPINGGGTDRDRSVGLQQYRQVCEKCGAKRVDAQIGLENTPELYVAEMVAIFRQVKRVLRKDGTLWLNLGDSYWGGKGENGSSKARATAETRGYSQSGGTVQMSKRPSDGRHAVIKPKDLCGIPWLVAFALRADGWYLRQDIVWSKPNPMPESVIDRCTKSHEYIFLLSKSPNYYYDQKAILEDVSPNTHLRLSQDLAAQIGSERANGGEKSNGNMKAVGRKRSDRFGGNKYEGEKHSEQSVFTGSEKRNKRSVWEVGTHSFSEAHFATFPPELIKPCILAGCPAGGTLLDPFMGAGTTALVAQQNHCQAIGVELNREYIDMSAKRLSQEVLDFPVGVQEGKEESK